MNEGRANVINKENRLRVLRAKVNTADDCARALLRLRSIINAKFSFSFNFKSTA